MNKYDFEFSSRVRRLRTPPMNSNQILKKYQKMYVMKNFCSKLFLQMKSHYALNALKNAAFTRIAIKLQLTLESCCTINLVLTIFFYILQRMYIKINSL